MHAPVPLPPPVRTACPYCGVGCGVLARPDGSGGAITTGDPDHPANSGRLCSKGFALEETLGLRGRLLHPMLRRADKSYAEVDWDTATAAVADGFRKVIDRHGPGAGAFYLSGQLLTEDYYVANKLAKGFLGTANVDTNSRLCMASTVAGHRRAFGEDVVPGSYEDLDQANLVVLVGSNTAWCHPVLFQRIARNRKERSARIVVIDPRRTVTGDEADLFLAIAPGSDTALFSGLLVYLAEVGALDQRYIDAHTNGFAEALMRAREIAPDAAATAAATGLDEGEIAQFFQLFRSKEKVVTCFSQGVNQSAQGTDKVNAIINCHLATGRIGKPGMGPFSLTGQPNAMGGREVGGLANMLAAHMGFAPDEVDRVRRFWNAPRMAEREGLKAVQMFEAIERGEIKALWVMATNPAVSLPRAGAMGEALNKLDLFVVSENMLSNDTVSAAPHVLLPAAAWGEKDGTVTNSERRISRQRAFLPMPEEVKPDWWIIAQVARQLGYGDAFSYRNAAGIFREHAALSAFENDGARVFDLGGLSNAPDEDYDALEPVQWPVRASQTVGTERLFADGQFSTPDRKARFIAPERPALREDISADFPLRLNTGRLRDQWHTMTRSGQSPRLGSHKPEPFAEIHPLDAKIYGLSNGGFVRVHSRHGSCLLKVVTSAGQQRGSIFAPIHWSAANASCARVGDLVAPETDPFSGQPEAKATPVAVERVDFTYRGFALSREALPFPRDSWWIELALPDITGYAFASNDAPAAWRELAPNLFPDATLTEYVDRRRGIYRAAAFNGEQLEGALFLGPAEAPPQWRELGQMTGRMGLSEPGQIVCACFSVGLSAIQETLASGKAATAAEIGKALRAGTKCGTCLPEIESIATHELNAKKPSNLEGAFLR
ncbi:nitrate reductase [Rhodoplanes sp. Z2-YC6860]|uniref:nitrate reductase n=1 Tax=Rhodoplanes sp. Z2-YC6860 TaxID=674703 RepID=UPI00078C8E4C|nr:nitrate reductase [Rhodoplanes sp. Z2-YC6860]AMN43790.1 molybdopterin oxidoreductase [Rhodoplanes sp. Z2-YC6860]